jgi:arginine repressor
MQCGIIILRYLMKKIQRQNKILKLVRSELISSQLDLSQRLRSRAFE